MAQIGTNWHKSHSRGPYTQSEKELRRDEVCRLHIEYGYSARKIANLMKISRNTINADVDFLYGSTVDDYNLIHPKTAVVKQFTKLEIQKTRLRESLDKTQNFSEKIAIERLIFDIDSKLINIRIKISESNYHIHELATKWLNNFSKNHGQPSRYYDFFDTAQVSIETRRKIKKLIKDDPYVKRSK